MTTKPWYLSKTIIGAMVLFFIAFAQSFGVELGEEETTVAVEALASIAGFVLTVYGRVTATKKLK
jgi:hypothetical protein